MASLVIALDGWYVFLLVFARLAAMIGLNPIFSRNNVPNMARMGLVMCLAMLIAPLQTDDIMAQVNGTGFLLLLFREIIIGIIYGFVFVIFYYLLAFVGDLMDTDMGFSNAKIFDPATNIQSSLSGRILTTMFALYFFATGAHLAIFRLFAESFNFIPLGTLRLGVGVPTFMLKLFIEVYGLAIRLHAPFLVGELLIQASMGILMKLNPKITIFVINFPLKIIVGVIMLFAFAPFVGNFVDSYMDILYRALDAATVTMGR